MTNETYIGSMRIKGNKYTNFRVTKNKTTELWKSEILDWNDFKWKSFNDEYDSKEAAIRDAKSLLSICEVIKDA